MWIFLNDAFLSIVADRHNDKLLVRARIAGDIERVFPSAAVIASPDADYAYRAWVARDTVADTLFWQAQSIAYPNFKNSVRENDRHDAYMQVWSDMNRYQQRNAAPSRPFSLFDDDDFDEDDGQPIVTRQAKKPARHVKRQAPTRRMVKA